MRTEQVNALETELDIQFSELDFDFRPSAEQFKSTTIYMNIGLGQGFTKNTLSEFLIEEAGLDAKEIKNVVIEDNRSYFDVSEKLQQQVFYNIKGYKLSHRNLKLSLDGVASKRNVY